MLPLWIIDITSATSARKEAFLRLLSSIEHVYMDAGLREALADSSEGDAGGFPQTGTEEGQMSTEMRLAGADLSQMSTEMRIAGESLSFDEQQDVAERMLAAKNAVIEGDYWYYSTFRDYFSGVNIDKEENIDRTAERLYSFQEAVVEEGKRFIHSLRQSNVRPYQTVNVMIIGDSMESFSRTVFPSIAAILQKEKGRILPGHIHQGMCIFGALYVPCNINSMVVSERSRVLRMLEEIEVQHNLAEIRGYDYMLLYQNVQNRTECTYTMLDEQQQAEYLMQCIVNLFLACDINHPMLSGTSSDDTFYFSMGATSLYFDMALEDANDMNIVARDLILNFKEEGDNEKVNENLKLLDESLYRAENFVGGFADVSRVDVEQEDVEKPSPHPIANFLQNNLKRLYYGYYLRFFPAMLLRKIINQVEEGTSVMLDRIAAHCTNMFKAAEMSMLPAITRIISKVSEQDGGLPVIEDQIRQMQESMSKEKARVRETIEHNFWDNLMDSGKIPDKQKQHFEEYHDMYNADLNQKNGGSGCEDMKRDATDKLRQLLSKEKTMLSTIVRCMFLGIVCVLAIVPILSMLSPSFINLGDVKGNAMIWSFCVFMLPVLAELIYLWYYMRKKAALIRVLRAYYTHDAYARIANRIEAEASRFYNKMIALGEEYLTRCKRIKKEVNIEVHGVEIRQPFPKTMFNQPLNGGRFAGEEIVPKDEIELSKIMVNHRPRVITDLTKPLYYMLINNFNDELAILFRGVGLMEDHQRRFNDETGEYEFVEREELLAERELEWQMNSDLFKQELLRAIKKEMVPREYPTVGEMINQYKRKTDRINLLEPMIAYAATNGEITSEADVEYADVKVNMVDASLLGTLPIYNTRVQEDKYDELYKKFIFVTRWRCFDHFSFNRIFPMEDFDQSVRELRVFEEEERMKVRKRRKAAGEEVQEQKAPYVLHTPSLILWAVCPDDNSGEWLRLFEAEYFSRAYSDREKLRKVLNQED